jgi:urease accessory protein
VAPSAIELASGTGRIDVCRVGRVSVVTRAFAASPLKLLMPANHGPAAWVYTSNYGGGLVDGDRLSLQITVGAAAALLLSTQASTKVYRSPRGTAVETRVVVDTDALCVIAPDPVVCFAGSRYRQDQQIALAGGASLVLVDWVTSGRRAAGERWAFDDYSARTVVRSNGRLLVYDSLALRASEGDVALRLGRFEVLATVVLAGPAVQSEAATMLANLSTAAPARQADFILAAAPLGQSGGDGCAVRIAGTSVEAVSRQIRRLLAFVPPMLGDDPWSRKW